MAIFREAHFLRFEPKFRRLTELSFDRTFGGDDGGTDSVSHKFAVEFGLFPEKPLPRRPIGQCIGKNGNECGRGMGARNDPKCKGGWMFECSARATCRLRIAAADNTWFSHAHYSFYRILLTTFYFAKGASITEVIDLYKDEFTQFSPQIMYNWFNFARQVCCWKVHQEITELGGPGFTVEVDETFFRTKPNPITGVVTERILFGAICKETKEVMLWQVDNVQGENTLWPIMRQHIRAGTMIHTDGAQQYVALTGPAGNAFFGPGHIAGHEVVIHAEGEFVRFDDEGQVITTNHIENVWGHLKYFTTMHGDDDHFQLKLGHFLYDRLYLNGLARGLKFYRFLRAIKEFYPGPLHESPPRNESFFFEENE